MAEANYSNWWVEVSDGLFRKTPPEMIRVSELAEWQERHKQSEQGLYSSIYCYPTDDPYIGGVTADLYFDLDSEEDPHKARKEAVALVKSLIKDYNIPEEVINIAFSGMKGISISISHEVFDIEARVDLPLIWKSIVKNIISKLGLKTVDTQVYDRRRLWRLVNSKHQKSGLYKIPLTLTELEKLSIEEIKEKAAKPRPQPFLPIKPQPVSKAVSLFSEYAKKVEQWKRGRKEVFQKAELASLGKEGPPCVQRLFEQGADEDMRNISLFQLAVYWSQKGLSEEEIVRLGYEFAKHCKPGVHPFPEGEEIERTVHSAYQGVQDRRYSVGCSSEAFEPLCDRENCPFFNPIKQEWMKVGEPITCDEWRKIITKNFPNLWPYAEACASTIAVLLIKDAQPLALVLQGVPGSGKTTTLDFFRGFPFSHATDKFTPKAFVSHVAQKSEEELRKIDLLPRIKDKVLVTPDLSTLFGAKSEELKEIFSLLTRVLDGRGLRIDSGVYGTRGYEGDYMFTWVGATTPIPHNVWDLFGNLGARMYFVHVTKNLKQWKSMWEK